MKKFWKLAQIIGFEKVDMKGLARWFLAVVIIGNIVSRMNMQPYEHFVNILSIDFMSFMLGFGLYGMVYNTLTNAPRFSRELPYTSRQEVNMRIVWMIQYISIMAVFFVIYIVVWVSFSGEVKKLHINYGSAIRYLIFSLFFYSIMIALMFPLGVIRDKKKWYFTLAGVAIVMATISLVFINLLPGNSGFRTSGMVFENVALIENCDVVLGIMGIITLITLRASYIITQKMHAPKRYE